MRAIAMARSVRPPMSRVSATVVLDRLPCETTALAPAGAVGGGVDGGVGVGMGGS